MSDAEKKAPGVDTASGTCCEKETQLPTAMLEREKFCRVSNEGRKVTDCFCCLIFLGFLAAWAGCLVVGLEFGEPLSLIYAYDYKGRLCGTNEFENQTRTYYPRLKDDLLEFAQQTLGDITTFQWEDLMNSLDFSILNMTGICVESCPVIYDIVCTPDYLLTNPLPTSAEVASCYGGETIEDPTAVALLGLLGVDIPRNAYYLTHPQLCSSCWNVVMNTTEVFYRCFDIITTVTVGNEICTYPDMRGVNETLQDGSPNPDWVAVDDPQCLTKRVVDTSTTNKPTYDNPLAEFMGSTMTTLQSWARDVQSSWYAICVVGVVGAMGLGFVWVAFLRVCTGCIVWGTIVGFIVALAGVATYCWLMTGYFDTVTIAEWVADAATTVGLDSLAENLETWVNTTDFGNVNLSSSDVEVVSGLAPGLEIETDTQTLWRVGAFTLTIIWLIIVILVIVVAKKIKIAIAIIEEASVAIMRMPCLVCFPFFTALFLLINAIFFIFSVALMASAEGITVGEIVAGLSGYFDLNCSTIDVNATLESQFENITINASDIGESYESIASAIGDTAASLTCGVFDWSAQYSEVDVITFLNWFQLFCFLWNNSVLQGIGIMVVAGAVADWYWTRPSFDPSVSEKEWMSHLEGARSFHGLPEGVFVQRQGQWDLMLCVDRLAVSDDHVVKYDKNDATHRQLLAMRGYETEPVEANFIEDEVRGNALYVRFDMENLATWKTGIRQGIEAQGEDPRAFYSEFSNKRKPCSRAPVKIEHGLKACLKHGKVSAPGWRDKDINGVPAWKRESKSYYPHVQDPAGYYGPVDVNFGKIITNPDHQRLNNAYVHQMLLAGKLRKGGNGKDFKWPFCNSIYRVFRYHLGSVCVGAFIIALVQFIRIIFTYIDKQTKTWQNKNKCFRCMFKVIHAIMCLLERCLKYITKNAYIMVAMRGKPFCEACCASFKLLLANLVQFVVVGIFSKVVVLFGKIFIVILACLGTYAWVKVDPLMNDQTLDTYIDNSFIPVTLTGLIAFGVASAFLHVYDLAIATILLCFCEDYKFHSVEESSKKADHDEVYMPSSLKNIVLSAESRRHLAHPMTYEEARLYSQHVHQLAPPEPPKAQHPCGRKSKNTVASVAPATHKQVAKQPEESKKGSTNPTTTTTAVTKVPEPVKHENSNHDIV